MAWLLRGDEQSWHNLRVCVCVCGLYNTLTRVTIFPKLSHLSDAFWSAVERGRERDKERDIERDKEREEECVSGAFWGLFAAVINIRYE